MPDPLYLARHAKLIAALVGAATTAVTLGLLPDPAADHLAVVVAFLTAAGVYAVPNATPQNPPE